MNPKYLAGALLLASVAFMPVLTALHAQPGTTPQAPPPSSDVHKTQPAAKQAQQDSDDGQKVFEQNCSRCHTAPEGFSPRISGTILRHMRVRANLSKQDEQKLLRFLNP